VQEILIVAGVVPIVIVAPVFLCWLSHVVEKKLNSLRERRGRMKLWLLRPVRGLAMDDDPWNLPYDKVYGFVMRAETGEEARQQADEYAMYESDYCNPWLEKKYSICVELTPEGPPGMVMRDYRSGGLW